MKSIGNRIKDFFLQHELWLFLAVTLLFSYTFMQMGHQLSWRFFYGIAFGLSLLFLPLLLFVFLRRQRLLGATFNRAGWIITFLLLPALLTIIWPWHLNDLPGVSAELSFTKHINRFGPLFLWLTLLVLEGLYQWNQKRSTVRTANWLLHWNIPRLAIIIVALFSVLIVPANNYFIAQTQTLSHFQTFLFFGSAVLQTFLIYMSYYLIYYVHHHFLFNDLLRKKGLLYYLLGAIGFLLLFIPLQNELILLFPAVELIKIHPLGLIPQVFADLNFTLPLAFFLLSLPFIIMVEWYRQANAISTLEQEKTTTELQLLKQQINPHFFFNTLNNLYAMSLTQEEETPETILQLSELMRYVIYKGQEEKVPLKLEVKYLQDYLDLQRLRLHQDLDLQFNIKMEDEECLVPPLFFIILLENAFKHGIEPAAGASYLYLELEQHGTNLRFRCRNSQETDNAPTATGGLGLTNLRRRLSMAYPDRHQLTLRNSDTEYIAELSLDL